MAQAAPIRYGISWSVAAYLRFRSGRWPARLSTAEPSYENFWPITFAVPRHWLFLKIASDHGSGPATSYVRDFDDQFPLRDSFLREYADVPRGQFEHQEDSKAPAGT